VVDVPGAVGEVHCLTRGPSRPDVFEQDLSEHDYSVFDFFVVTSSRRHDEHDETRGYFGTEHLCGRRDASWRRDRSKVNSL
jgi:hypothetical protein